MVPVTAPAKPIPISDLAAWWNSLDLGAPPTELLVVTVDQMDPADSTTWLDSALVLLQASRQLELELEPISTALVASQLGTNLMKLTPVRLKLDGTIDYQSWITSCTQVRDYLFALHHSPNPLPDNTQASADLARDNTQEGTTRTATKEPVTSYPAPFEVVREIISSRSQAGLPTLISGAIAATGTLLLHSEDQSIIDQVRTLSFSTSPIETQVAQQLAIPPVIPYQIALADKPVCDLALALIAAAVDNSENLRLATLAELNPQTEA